MTNWLNRRVNARSYLMERVPIPRWMLYLGLVLLVQPILAELIRWAAP